MLAGSYKALSPPTSRSQEMAYIPIDKNTPFSEPKKWNSLGKPVVKHLFSKLLIQFIHYLHKLIKMINV